MATGLVAKVDGSHGETDDGVVTWSTPLELMSRQEADNGATPTAVIAPGAAPLEIGYTLPSRTIAHLDTTGAVWRWPYNSERLWLLAYVTNNQGDWQIRPRIDEVLGTTGLLPTLPADRGPV